MHKTLMFLALVVTALGLTAVAFADPGDSGKSGKAKHAKFSFAWVTTDGSSCAGKDWATDTETRTYSVKDNGDGTYTLMRRDKGTFVTNGVTSPGACETTGHHGSTVAPGVKGKFVGYLRGTISGGTFNPNAICPADCAARSTFIATFFGPTAKYSCDAAADDCSFNFNYTAAHHQKLKYRHWQDKGRGATEVFLGDIANA